MRPKHPKPDHGICALMFCKFRYRFSGCLILTHSIAVLVRGVRKGNVQRTPGDNSNRFQMARLDLSHIDGTMILSFAGPLTDIFFLMTNTLIGYARCSTDKQDLAAQRTALVALGVVPDRSIPITG